MILFGIIIIVAQIIIVALNLIFNNFNLSALYIIGAVVISTVAEVVIDAITEGITRALPRSWFNPFYNRFKVSKKEQRFYDKLGIRKWKDKVPDLGFLTKFNKNKVQDPTNNKYIERYLLEAAYGRVGHLVSLFTGFSVIFIYPLKFAINFGIPVAIVNFVLNLMTYMVLRYNFPKLLTLHKRNSKRESIVNTEDKPQPKPEKEPPLQDTELVDSFN